MAQIECPSCFFEFEPEEDVMKGEVVPCPDCGVDLEILDVKDDVIEVEVAEMGEEDWGE